MGRPRSNRPTDAEIEILRVLWQRGPATVRDISDELTRTKKIAYTSIATIVRIMVEKKMVEIVDIRRPQKFRAVIDENDARKSITDEWLSRMFNGSITNLVRHAMTGRKCSPKEIAELKKIIEEAR
jgi:predicted transcriptional regulator